MMRFQKVLLELVGFTLANDGQYNLTFKIAFRLRVMSWQLFGGI